ncbi:hypothetical protein VTJ83DRAFT_127 [Remersonia thermophila]|uniref:Autophagy-related protein 14 n=1 Tax=Remersonia thermophila TaxID=72144 RepID=A0ABR4DLQ0_9PEZI
MSAESTRPLLLPQNRKIRHLRGLALRNLAFSRPRGHSVDDAAVNIQSPAKLDASLVHPSAAARQRHFEDTFDSRLADAFFSLHVDGEEEPIYVSEVEERGTNFNFRFFDLSDLDAAVTRSPRLTIHVWARRRCDSWALLLEDDVDLRALQWLGSLDKVHFPPNSLVFHLVDGVYSLDLSGKPAPPKHAAPAATSSYTALMRLATLDSSIQDALATRERLARQINDLLASEARNAVPEAEDSLALANKYLAQQRRAVAQARRRNEDLRASIAARRDAIAQGRAAQERTARDVQDAAERLAQNRTLLDRARADMRGQRRRICEDLARIYNIGPVPLGPPLAFQICGISLPNTDYDGPAGSSAAVSEDALSAALGHVAQLTDALQYYLSVPLPYPICPFGSRSTIRDDISQIPDAQREFPLYLPRGGSAAQYRFDYGWFLLNKDIEALCASQGLRVVDIRHTLPNLKYLLYVCSAGSDELPARKRGGVRGLWAGRARGPPGVADDASSLGTASRRGSDASDALARPREELRRALAGTGRAADEPGNGHVPNEPPSLLPFGGEMKLSLRTKGLRESAAQ